VLVLGVAELAEQFADAGSLGADLGVCGLERPLGVWGTTAGCSG
jgi:hypothetical protein